MVLKYGLAVTVLACAAICPADETDWRAQTKAAVDRGLVFLAATQQADGGWEDRGRSDPAITSLVAKCFIQSPDYGPGHPVSKRAIRFILRNVQSDGGIYVPDRGLNNYYTSVAVMALSATRQAEHHTVIQSAQAFLKKGQWDEAESIDKTNSWYGGAGYGSHKRPDLSNTQMMLEALKQSGLSRDDPAYQKALVFISRSQMLAEHNDQKFARGASDGGFIYTPANDGESKAGVESIGGKKVLRSYGSMTYAGFKSMLYAGLSRDDRRVRAAFDWFRQHYTLDANPNMPAARSQEGLYYYYHTFARALDTWGDETIADAAGSPHLWRRELCEKLCKRQRSDGSWVNDSDRWFEGNPHLVSAYAILAIQTAAR